MAMNEEERQRAVDEARSKQSMEQNAAFIRDFLPSLWKGMYDNLKVEGFPEADAFILLQTYVIATNCTSGLNGPKR